MATPRPRSRAHAGKEARANRTSRGKAVRLSADASMVPRSFWAAVNGVEAVAVGIFRFGRSVLGSSVSQVASIGGDALTVAAAGARGVASAASRMADGIAGTAKDMYLEALAKAKESPRRAKRHRPSSRNARPRVAT